MQEGSESVRWEAVPENVTLAVLGRPWWQPWGRPLAKATQSRAMWDFRLAQIVLSDCMLGIKESAFAGWGKILLNFNPRFVLVFPAPAVSPICHPSSNREGEKDFSFTL